MCFQMMWFGNIGGMRSRDKDQERILETSLGQNCGLLKHTRSLGLGVLRSGNDTLRSWGKLKKGRFEKNFHKLKPTNRPTGYQRSCHCQVKVIFSL